MVLQRDWRLAIVSLTVLPIVLVPTIRIGRRIRRTTRHAQDNAAELNEILQEAIVGQQVVKAFGSEKHESSRFHAAAWKLRNANLRYVAQQAIASPLIEFFGALTIVGLLDLCARPDQGGQSHDRRVHELRDRPADAVRASEAAHRNPRDLSAGDGSVAKGIRISRPRGADRRQAERPKADMVFRQPSSSMQFASDIRTVIRTLWTASTCT